MNFQFLSLNGRTFWYALDISLIRWMICSTAAHFAVCLLCWDTQKSPVTVEPSLSYCFHSCAPGSQLSTRSPRILGRLCSPSLSAIRFVVRVRLQFISCGHTMSLILFATENNLDVGQTSPDHLTSRLLIVFVFFFIFVFFSDLKPMYYVFKIPSHQKSM